MNKFLQYQVFIAVVEEGSLSGAARALSVTPSAVSKQLTALEDSLNSQLVERTNKSSRPTPIGNEFYEKCKKVILSMNEAEKSITSKKQIISGSINITLSKSLIRSKVFYLLSEFQKLHPQIKFNLIFSDQVLDLYENNIDFAFRLGDLGDSSRLHGKYLMDTHLVCCATADYIIRNGKLNDIEDLKRNSLILPEAKNLSTELRRYFKKNNLELNYKNWHNTNDIEAIYQAIKNNFAAGFLLDISIEEELRNGLFYNLLPSSRLPSKKLHLMYKKRSHSSKSIDLFRKFFINRFK